MPAAQNMIFIGVSEGHRSIEVKDEREKKEPPTEYKQLWQIH